MTKKRILIVEDEFIVALAMENALESQNFEVVGPTGTVQKAVGLAEAEDFDAALLDVNLGDQSIAPVAAILKRRSIPFVFISGYGRESLPEDYRDARLLQKPIREDELVAVIQGMLP